MVVNALAVGVAAALSLVAVALHFSKGTEWEGGPDVSEEVLRRRAESVPETEFPEPMSRAVGGGGATAAVGAGAAGEEGAELEEGDEEEDQSPADIPEDEVEYFEVEFAKQGETIELANNRTVLEQGEDEGWDLPYACRQGQCVSCCGQITSGGSSEDYVVHHDQEALSEDEMGEGYTLTCVAYPRSDFTIETGESP